MDSSPEAVSDDRIPVEIGKIMDQTMRLASDQVELGVKSERAWVPPVAIIAAAGAGAALTVLLLRLYGG